MRGCRLSVVLFLVVAANLFARADSWSRDRAEALLRRWCDALEAYQVKAPADPRVRGSLLCPACALQHGRVCDVVYPMTYLWTKTKDPKYLDCAVRAVAWSRHNLTDMDGARLRNDFQNVWWGISVFSQIAVGKTLLRFAVALPREVREDWRGWFVAQSDFVGKALDVEGNFNVNYSAALCEAMALAWKLTGEERHLEVARRRAKAIEPLMMPDGMLAGEKHPPDFVSPHGYRPVDLGYNAEESIPSLYHYVEMTGDGAFADKLDALGRGVLAFVLPDGAIDNSMGSRLCKWTYYGSRTSDGALPMFAAMAVRGIPGAVRAIDRHLALLERCTSRTSGLLTGGLFYDAADEGACVHHAFAHAKSLVDLLVSDAPTEADSAALPREAASGVREFPSFGTTLVAVGPWRASFSLNDVHHNPAGTMNGGGSLTLLYHEKAGLVCAGTMARYSTLEHENMQVPRREGEVKCMTPRIEWADGAFSSEDADATGRAAGTPAGVTYEARGSRFEQRSVFAADDVTLSVSAKGRWRYVLPVVAGPADEVSVSGGEATVRRKDGVVRLVSSVPLRLERTSRGERAFTPVAGLMTAYLTTEWVEDGTVSVKLSCDGTVRGETGKAPAARTTAEGQGQVVVEVGEETLGAVKPLNGVNNGPVKARKSQSRQNFEAFRAANIPYARTHDAAISPSYGGEHTVDITAVFPDFDADENDPASYDFACTDRYLATIREAGTETFYRLGQKIEHSVKKYGTLPPKDFAKWARICEHVIRHYNEGWADGFHYGLQYWEIWNEPDLDKDDAADKRTWGGTKAEFFAFYRTVALHLKAKFPHLKIGGPAAVCVARLDWMEDFLKEMTRAPRVPLDFFSWHIYFDRIALPVALAGDVRRLLDKYGYTQAESIYDEWNYRKDWSRRFVKDIEAWTGLKGGALVAATMCAMSRTSVDKMMYYDARPETVYNGLFDFYSFRPLPGYWSLFYWGDLRRKGTGLKVALAGAVGNDVEAFAAVGGDGSKGLLVACYDDTEPLPPGGKEVRIAIAGGVSEPRLRMVDSAGLDREVPVSFADGVTTLKMERLSVAYLTWRSHE